MLDQLPLRLKKARHAVHMTQATVASMVGVNPAAISAYENGTRRPSYEVLIHMATIYKRSTDYLLGLSSDEQKPPCGLEDEEAALFREFVRLIEERHSESARSLSNPDKT